ncbi:MAG TPA: carboxypeptidase-like regulatory domain-containing protein, partial [Planctomycetota bacterium]|nr:carboxypeptidase-like regulatory domain-containing protein [Planctomycetota bacterium]
PLGTVKTRLSRGIELLRQDLEQRTRGRGKDLSSLIAGLALVERPSASAAPLTFIGGLFVIQKLVAAVVVLIVGAAGWWAWSSQHTAPPSMAEIGSSTSDPALATPPIGRDETATRIREASTPQIDKTAAQIDPWLRLHVVDDTQTALPKVKVHAVSDTAVTLLGETNAQGELGIHPVSPSTVRLVFSAADCAVRELEPPTSAQRELQVVLQGGGAIRGRVVLAGSASPAQGIVVVAMLSSERSSGSKRFARFQIEDPSITRGLTDADGAFSIEGLSLGERYKLSAGSPGFIASKRVATPLSVVPCDQVLIEVERAYGVDFRLVDAVSGDAIELGVMAPAHRLSTLCLDRRACSIPPGSIETFLAGLDRDLYASSQGIQCIVSLPESLAECGPIEIDASLPGFDSAKVTAMATPLGKALPIVRVPLNRVALAFGTIAITWQSPTGVPAAIGEQLMPMGELVLTAPDAAPIVMLVNLKPGVEQVLSRVPAGSYQWSISANNHQFRYPPKDQQLESILVEAERQAEIRVPLAQAGSILLQIENTDGSAYQKNVMLALKRTQQDGGNFIGFNASPYRIYPLEPGTYSLEIWAPEQLHQAKQLQPAPVVVTAGDESSVRVRM